MELVRPVKVTKVKPLASYDKEYLGVVDVQQMTNYAFRVGGLIKDIYVTEGSNVTKGETLARLDQADLKLQMNADRAQYITAKSILERSKRLLEREAIALQDYEIAQANFEQARAAYDYSQNQLSYTTLLAPFTGSVEKRYAEPYQKVSAGEQIFKIINPEQLNIKFTLPQSDLQIPKVGHFFIEFENNPDKSYKARVDDIVDVSVAGAGIPVTLSIVDSSFDVNRSGIKAGFACRVRAVIDSEVFDNLFTVPLTAVFASEQHPELNYVWVYDPIYEIVEPRLVQLQGLYDKGLYIIKGNLKPGESVVSAGVYQLTQGQRVKLLD